MPSKAARRFQTQGKQPGSLCCHPASRQAPPVSSPHQSTSLKCAKDASSQRKTSSEQTTSHNEANLGCAWPSPSPVILTKRHSRSLINQVAQGQFQNNVLIHFHWSAKRCWLTKAVLLRTQPGTFQQFAATPATWRSLQFYPGLEDKYLSLFSYADAYGPF